MHTAIAPTKHRIPSQSKVLAIENERDSFYLANTLKLLDCNCLITNEAMSALSLAQQEQPDLILVNLQLPQLNGIELLNTLRIDWLTRNIPVVATVARTAGWKKRLLNVEFNGYLFKPYRRQDVQTAIAFHLTARID